MGGGSVLPPTALPRSGGAILLAFKENVDDLVFSSGYMGGGRGKIWGGSSTFPP